MIANFTDFCLYAYVIVDDIVQEIAPLFRRPGPVPVFSDSELIALCIIGECKGWDVETELLSNMEAYRELFPHLPEQSRFNRRRRNLMVAMNLIRRILLSQLDLAQDHHCVIDSLPIPAVQFHLVPTSTGLQSRQALAALDGFGGKRLHLLLSNTVLPDGGPVGMLPSNGESPVAVFRAR